MASIERAGPVVDPTENVKALVIAESKRQDDIANLREQLEEERIKRVEDLANMHASHVTEIIKLHAAHDDQMHAAETQMGKEMAARIAALEKITAEGKGKGEGMGATWAALIGAAGLAGTLIMIGLFIFGGKTANNVPPQTYYTPATPGTLVPSTPSQPAPR